MENKIIISGFGGQGVMILGRLLAYASMLEKKTVVFLQSYGGEMRGGTANCSLTISDKEIGSPVVEIPDYCIAMNLQSLDRFEPIIHKEGVLLLNSTLIPKNPKRQDIKIIKIPATDIANEMGNILVTNMVMLGAFIRATDLVDLKSIIKSLNNVIPSHRKHLVSLNKKAIFRGAKWNE